MNPAGLGPTIGHLRPWRRLLATLAQEPTRLEPADILQAAPSNLAPVMIRTRSLCPPALSCLNAFVCLSFSFFDHSRFQVRIAPAPIRWIVQPPLECLLVFHQEHSRSGLRWPIPLGAEHLLPQRHVWCPYGLSRNTDGPRRHRLQPVRAAMPYRGAAPFAGATFSIRNGSWPIVPPDAPSAGPA